MALQPSGLTFQNNERIKDWTFMSFMIRIPFRIRAGHTDKDRIIFPLLGNVPI